MQSPLAASVGVCRPTQRNETESKLAFIQELDLQLGTFGSGRLLAWKFADGLSYSLPKIRQQPLRRYLRRWRVEQFFVWLHHFRRLVIRWEYHVENFFGMVRPGCMQILLRYV